ESAGPTGGRTGPSRTARSRGPPPCSPTRWRRSARSRARWDARDALRARDMTRISRGTRDAGRGTQKGDRAIGIIGLGLMGGSLAKAVAARYPRRPLIGVDPSAKARRL